MNNDDYDVFLKCDCGDVGHNIVLNKFTWDYDYKGVTEYKHDFGVHVRIVEYKSLWSRIVHAYKYIFGITRGYDYAEIILNDDSVDKLQNFIDDYRKCNTKEKV